MAVPVMMPNVGITVETCVLTQWCKRVGEAVSEGELLFVYETDKSTLEQEAPCSGVILAQFFAEDDDVPVMTNVCVIGKEGEGFEEFAPQSQKAAAPAQAAPEEQRLVARTQEAPAGAVLNSGFIKASPRAKALAAKSGVDLAATPASGPNGRIIEQDVRLAAAGAGMGGRYLAKAAPGQGYADEKLSTIRKTIAKQMLHSLETAAQLTHTLSFDAGNILAFRKEIKENGAALGYGNITLNDMVLFVVSRTLAMPEYRALNAHLLEGDVIRYWNGVHMGVAVDTQRGLVVPTLRDCDKKSLNEISEQAKALAAQCRNGNMLPEVLQGGTFTVSNLGAYGIEHFTPIINTPQTAILGVNTITTKIRAVDGGIQTYQAMGLSLTYDHRAVDGGPASRFLKQLQVSLERFTDFLKEQEN